MIRRTLMFLGPQQVQVREEEMPALSAGQVLVRTRLSAISPGSELLIYNGLVASELALDASITALSGSFQYPFKYGYCSIGEVSALGVGVPGNWLGQRVFSFHPHESHYAANLDELMPIADDISDEDAVFLPNMETAVNFLLDGQPLIGERVAVLGQGVVGLLTTALLARLPLSDLVTLDRFPLRRRESLRLGASLCLDPADPQALQQARALFCKDNSTDGADLTFELSGSPAALDSAIALTAFSGRVVIGSWYGLKPVALDLGGRFHRSRMRLICSQVSTISPELSGRWTKARRLQTAWQQLRVLRPSMWVTHRFPFDQAAEAYHLLSEAPQQTIQVIFTY